MTLALLMSFVPSPARSENEVPEGLTLPKGQIVPGDNDEAEFILFSMEEFRTVVHIYNGYVLYDENRDYILRLKFLDFKLEEIKDERLVQCKEIKEDLKTEVKGVFDIWSEEHKLRLKDNNKSSTREVFIGLGAGVGGVVLGIAAGIIIATVTNN